MYNEGGVNNGMQNINVITTTHTNVNDDVTKNIANQTIINVNKTSPTSSLCQQLSKNDASTSSSYSDISASCESLSNITEFKISSSVSQNGNDRCLETRKRSSDSIKPSPEKRQINNMEIEKQISELIKENMILKSRLNGKTMETLAAENKRQPKMSSVIVTGPSFFQQEQKKHKLYTNYDDFGTIPQLFTQQSNFYNFSNEAKNNFTNVNKNNQEAENQNESNVQENVGPNLQFESKQKAAQSTHKDTNLNLPHYLADTNSKTITEIENLKVNNHMATPLIKKNINNVLLSNVLALSPNNSATQSNNTPPEIPLTINCNNYSIPSNVGVNVPSTMHSAAMLELCDLHSVLQPQQQQQSQQQLVVAAAAALISNYQAYCHHPQILSSLSLNKILNNNGVENLTQPELMSNEDALHLSAFQPFNQLYYEQSLASLNANSLCSSLDLPPFYSTNSKNLNQFDFNYKDNLTDEKMMRYNLLQQNYINLTSQASGSTPVIIQPKTSQGNFNQKTTAFDLTSHQVSSSSSNNAFGLNASEDSESVKNICSLSILPQPDSSSNESLRLTDALESSIISRQTPDHIEFNVRPSVLLHSSTNNKKQSFSPNNNLLITIDTSNPDLQSSSTADALTTVFLPKSNVEKMKENNRKTVLELGTTKPSYIIEPTKKTQTNEAIIDKSFLKASSTTSNLNAYQNYQSHSMLPFTLDNTQINKNDISDKVCNNNDNEDKNDNENRKNLAPYSSLLGTLLATTRRSPTVPESRTELQSGLGGGNYSASSSSSSAIIKELTSQIPLELKKYPLLGHSGGSHPSTYAASLMPPFSLLLNKNKENLDEESINKFIMTSSSSRYTSSTHSTNDTKYDSEHSIPSPQSFDSNISSSVIANSNYEANTNKLLIKNESEDTGLTFENLEKNDELLGSGRRNSVLSNTSLNSNESLRSRTHVSSPSCRDIFSSSYTSSMSNASISLAKAINTFAYCGSESIDDISLRPDLERYMDRRRRNNEAAKRCRANRRAVYEYRFRRAQQLEAENGELRQEMLKLHNELEKLKGILNNGHSFLPNI